MLSFLLLYSETLIMSFIIQIYTSSVIQRIFVSKCVQCPVYITDIRMYVHIILYNFIATVILSYEFSLSLHVAL